MGVSKVAGDAMTLVSELAGGDVPGALVRYDASRRRFGTAVDAHGRELGSYLQGSDTPEARSHHTADAVMREIAVTRKYV
jgi:hypothetical protein